MGGAAAEWVRALALNGDRTFPAGFDSHCGRLCLSSSYCLQYALHMRSIIYCFGGVCAGASTILVVAIAKF